MKKSITLALVLSLILSLPIGSQAYGETANKSKVIDYTKETQLNQFRPHGGDREEITNLMNAFIKNVKTPKTLNSYLSQDTAQKAGLQDYVKSFAPYKDIKIVESTVEKLYTVKGFDVYNNYRAVIKFKYLEYASNGKVIEKTDYVGAGKFGKTPESWRIWGTVWRDSGIDVSDASLAQLDAPKKGEEICIMTTSAGTIKMRLFPAQAPKTVANFKTLAQKGYYNNTEFFRVINDFMIQGGSPDNTASGGESIYGKYFEDELSRDLFNFRGALCMGNEGYANTNGSQYYIVQRPKADPAHLALAALPLNAEAKYLEVGGCPHLDMRYTVFGQVFEGMDIVDKVAAAATDSEARPLKDPVKVTKIEFVPAS